jgi:hypothetical protein
MLNKRIRKALEGSDALLGDTYVNELEQLFKSEMLKVIETKEEEILGRYEDEDSPDDDIAREIKESNGKHDYVRFHLDDIKQTVQAL